MKKVIIVMAGSLLLSQSVIANNTDVLKCIDKTSLKANDTCVTKVFNNDIQNLNFYQSLSAKDYSQHRDAFASITYFPKKKLIEVKSLEPATKRLLAANR